MISYIWEISVCLIETLLFTYLIYKRIGIQPHRMLRLIISIFIMTGALSVLTFLNISTFQKIALMSIIYILNVLWTFNCSKNGSWYKALLWPSCYIIISTVAENITFSIADAMTDYPLEELMVMSSGRIEFTLIYLLLITLMVWTIVHIGETEPEIPFYVSLILFVFMGIGIFATESIIDISLELGMDPLTAGYAKALSLFCYIILLMLFALLITFESLGVILGRNKKLKQRHQLAVMEQHQYDLIVSATESLAQWKHDYQGQLRLIGALIEQEDYSELKQFAADLISDLPSSASLLFSGNRTMDAVISLRMIDAKRQNIRFETTLFLPDPIPLNDVVFASLVGNLLDNAIEACRKVPPEKAEIRFEIKPWKQMMCIFCSNTSNGKYVNGKQGNLLSTKIQEGHGVGIRRIKEIVSQAGGACQFIPEDERFSVSIMIPLEDNKNENCDSGE